MPPHHKENQILSKLASTKEENLVVIDFANVEKWKASLGWVVSVRGLGNIARSISSGSQERRRFYYCLDYGRSEKYPQITSWSDKILQRAQRNKFEFITKPVKYIYDSNYKTGFVRKGNLDIEMAVDIISMTDLYSRLIIFSGDGDLSYVIKYAVEKLGKDCVVFAARDHIGRELIDASDSKLVSKICYVEDFDYKLDMARVG